MNNDTYVFEGNQRLELVAAGIDKAIDLCKAKGVGNIKFVVQGFDYSFDFVAQHLHTITGDSTESIERRLTQRAYRIENDAIGINVISIRNFHFTIASPTVFLFLSAFESSFTQVKRDVIGSNFDVVLCVPQGMYDAEFIAALSNLNIVSHTVI